MRPPPAHHNALHPVVLHASGLTLEGFSISGVATWLIVHELDALFDVGECALQAVPVGAVFVTHIHGDHSRCLLRHWQLRRMFNLAAADYYVPASTVDGLRDIVRAEARMEGVPENEAEFPRFVALPTDGTPTPLRGKGVWARAFPVNHRVDSVGYTLGRTTHKLRPEFATLPGREIAALRTSGTAVSQSVESPLITFIGDCDGATLARESHIWESQVVVIECTYVDPEDRDNAARSTHTHLDEIVEVLRTNPGPRVQALVLKHFSLKSTPAGIRERVTACMPTEWIDRVRVLLPPG